MDLVDCHTHTLFSDGSGQMRDSAEAAVRPTSLTNPFRPTLHKKEKRSMDLVDCHTHTLFSDGSGQMRDSAEAAVRRGITTLCYTDHLTLPASLDPSCEVSIPEKLLPSYREAVLDTRSAFPMLDIVLGFECDYYPGCEPNVARWTDGATYRLGSVHMLQRSPMDGRGHLPARVGPHARRAMDRRPLEPRLLVRAFNRGGLDPLF